MSVSCDECGLDPLDNSDGCGWAGGTWQTLRKITGNDDQWIRDNPWDTNQALAELFTSMVKQHGLKVCLMCWIKGGEWKTNKEAYKKAVDYARVVCYISRRWLKKHNGGLDVKSNLGFH